MFGKSKRISELEAKLTMLEAQLKNKPVLISLQRIGRMNKFTFIRNGDIFTLETMGLMVDDTERWKQELFE